MRVLAPFDPVRLDALWNRFAAVHSEVEALRREFREAVGVEPCWDAVWVDEFRTDLVGAVLPLVLRRAGLEDLDEDEIFGQVLKLMEESHAGFDAAGVVRAVESHRATYEEERFALLVAEVSDQLCPRRPARDGATIRFSANIVASYFARILATEAKARRALAGGRKKGKPEGVAEHLRPGLESLGRVLDVLGGARPSEAKDMLEVQAAGTAHSGGRTLRWFSDGGLEITFASEDEAKAVCRLLWADRRMREARYTTARRGGVLLRGPQAIEAEMAALALAPAIRPIASTRPGR